MKVCILGAGGMGCVLGAYLKRGGAEVHFVDPYEEHVKAMQEKGLFLKMEHLPETWNIRLDSVSTQANGQIGPCDLVIVLVKGNMTRTIMSNNPEVHNKNTVVATFQNGLGNVDIVEEFVPRENIASGVLRIGAYFKEPGSIVGSISEDDFGNAIEYAPCEHSPRTDAVLAEMADIFNRTGLKAHEYAGVEALIWDKLYTNCLFNIPLAIMRCHIESGVKCDEFTPLLKQLGEEVCAVATAKGFPMNADEHYEKVVNSLRRLPDTCLHYSSAVQDTIKRRPTEVDFLNGAVVREGRKLGIPTPVNEIMWQLGRANVALYDKQF